jgi:hypothetical protein
LDEELYYHVAPKRVRESILEHGLCKRFCSFHDPDDPETGAVFVSDTLPDQDLTHFDIWVIDGKDLELWEDYTTEPPGDEKWYTTGDVAPSCLRLFTPPKQSSRPKL